ncbi:hypothetical protein UlMin_025594 [Ulmus minor]
MIILAWNCKGLGQPFAIRELKALVRDSSPDILIMMEAKISNVVMKARLQRLRFDKSVYVPPVSLSSGPCVAWRNEVDLETVSVSKNLISCLIFSDPFFTPWMLSAVYGLVRSAEKIIFWNELHKVDSVIRAKLNRCIANVEWWGLFPITDVKILPQMSSDHSPIVLNSYGCSNFLKRPFRFEAIWTSNKRSHWVVDHSQANAYHSHPSTRLSKHLFQTRRGLSVWNREQFGKIQTIIKETRKAIAAC